MKTKHSQCFHHGDLREALVGFALASVRSGGAGSFSLRDASMRAGVTPGAAYRHFPSRAAVLAEVASRGFALMNAHVNEAMKGRQPEARMASLGLAYVSFASKEPHLFALMFGRREGCDVGTPTEKNPDDAFSLLRQCIAELKGISGSEVDPADLAMAWCNAHGAARLVIDGMWKIDDPRISLAINKAVESIATTKDAKYVTKMSKPKAVRHG